MISAANRSHIREDVARREKTQKLSKEYKFASMKIG